MLISAFCMPSFADSNELPYVPADKYKLPELTPNGDCLDGFDVPVDAFSPCESSVYDVASVEDCLHTAWSNGVCKECGMSCEHSMYYGYCENCGLPCDHDWTYLGDSGDGYCLICHYCCCHYSWMGGYCEDCGKLCSHVAGSVENYSSDDFESIYIYCAICDDYADYIDGDHNYNGGVCQNANCGYVCKHTSVEGEGTCETCGMYIVPCEHSMGMDYYSDDRAYYEYEYCMNCCGYETEPYSVVPHTYVDGVCSVCSHACTHSATDENGDCAYCTPKADTPDVPDTPDTPKPSTPSGNTDKGVDEEGLDFTGFIGILGGAFAIFIVIYAWSAIKPKKR